MPRRNATILALVALAIIGTAVLYVIRPSPVHQTPPEALAALQFDPAPEPVRPATFVDPEGRPVMLSAFKGHFVVLNIWATWCAPCVRELPALGRLARLQGRSKFEIVTVNAGRESEAQTATFLKRHGAGDLPTYRDPQLSLLSAFGAQGLPFSVLLNAQGCEIARASGPMRWDDSAAVVYLRSLQKAVR